MKARRDTRVGPVRLREFADDRVGPAEHKLIERAERAERQVKELTLANTQAVAAVSTLKVENDALRAKLAAYEAAGKARKA